jgi:hypothetical protein
MSKSFYMTASNLKQEYLEHNPGGFFFSRATMKFFGDTMRNYGVRSAGGDDQFWELYRKRPVKNGHQSSAYFCKETFRRVYEWELQASFKQDNEQSSKSS